MAPQVHASFHGERAGDASLTWGQRGMWNAVALNAPSHFNIGRQLAVPAATAGAEDAADAIGRLLERHESLRTHIRLDDGEPYQEVARSGRLPVQVVEASADDAAETATALLGKLVKGGFDHARELPLRAGLVTAGGQVRSIVLVFCHVAADWPGTEIVLRDLRLLLAGSSDLPAPGLQPLDLARRQHQPDEQLTRRALAYWSSAYRKIPPTMFDPVGPAHHPLHQEAALTSPAASAAVQRVAARHRVSTSTVLLAATAALIGVWTGHPTCALSVVASNRFRSGMQDMVSVLSQLGVFVLDVPGQVSFDGLVRRAAPAALRAYWHAHYDQAALDRAVAAVREERGTEITPYCCFNDLRAPEDPAETARTVAAAGEAAVRAALADTTLTWTGQMEHIRCRFCLGVRDAPEDVLGNTARFDAGKRGARVLRLSLRADTRCLPPSHIEGFLTDLERLLVDAAFGEAHLPPSRAGLGRDGDTHGLVASG